MNAEEKRLHRLQILEDHIGQALQQSQQSGELQTAQNWGKPLDLGGGYAQTPLELRMGYKILKDAGVVPPEVELMRQIEDQRQAVDAATDPTQAQALRERLVQMQQHLALRLEKLRITGSL